jgi:alkanesulfonate monooxygenase SsuD/methylene tetrahydromethanopterin reductase-like flavin-dependent oxidoreductase (luciferase family)
MGDAEDEFAQMGLPFPPVPERQAALEETIKVVRGVWGDEPFTFEGRYARVRAARLRAGPVQRPHVPLMIAGGGERVTLRQVAEYADVSNFGADVFTGGARTLDDVGRKLDALRHHCEALGRPYDAVLKSHIALPLIAAESPSAVVAKLDARLAELPPAAATRRRAAVVAGTPSDLIAYYRGLADAGLRYFIAAIYVDDDESRELLARRVMPELTGG